MAADSAARLAESSERSAWSTACTALSLARSAAPDADTADDAAASADDAALAACRRVSLALAAASSAAPLASTYALRASDADDAEAADDARDADADWAASSEAAFEAASDDSALSELEFTLARAAAQAVAASPSAVIIVECTCTGSSRSSPLASAAMTKGWAVSTWSHAGLGPPETYFHMVSDIAGTATRSMPFSRPRHTPACMGSASSSGLSPSHTRTTPSSGGSSIMGMPPASLVSSSSVVTEPKGMSGTVKHSGVLVPTGSKMSFMRSLLSCCMLGNGHRHKIGAWRCPPGPSQCPWLTSLVQPSADDGYLLGVAVHRRVEDIQPVAVGVHRPVAVMLPDHLAEVTPYARKG